jgi:MSHA biogenesis protein MshM
MDANTDVHLFEEDAARAIARISAGVPRLINVLAHKCLMLAYGENVHRISSIHVRLAAQDTPGVVPRLPWWKRLWRARTEASQSSLSDAVLGKSVRSKP